MEQKEKLQETAEYFAVVLEETIGTSPHSRETIEDFFVKMANWQRNYVWHEVKKETPTDFGADVLMLCRNKNKENGIWLPDFIQGWSGKWEPRVNWEDPVLWAYLSDILPDGEQKLL